MKMFSTPSILLLSLVLGAGAGIVAASLTLGVLQNYSAAISNTGAISLTGERPLTKPESASQAMETVREKAAPAAVEIFSKPSDITGAYEPKEGQSRGFFVTSDGWLITAPYFFSQAEASRAKVVFNDKVYPVQKVVESSSSQVLFLKIEITNAPVLAFGNISELSPGDQLFVVPSADELFVSSLFRSVWSGAVSLPAEVSARRFELTDLLDSNFTGAPVTNSSGEVVGILVATEFGNTRTVLPFSSIQPAVYSLLKEGKVTDFWFGANVTDLSRVIGYDESFTRSYTKGALLGTITKNSPAEAAGLLREDIIISVGGLEISKHQSLDELLADYHPDDTVNLVVDRQGTVLKIDLVLKSN